MTSDQAKQIAQNYLDRLSLVPSHYAILKTVEKPYGWVIHWNTSKYVLSLDRKDSEIGTGPLVVEKTTGFVHQLSSGVNQEGILLQFEKERGFI